MNAHRHIPTPRPRLRGFTTIELLVACAVTAVIGLGIASMLMATTTATDPKNDLRAIVARHKMLEARLTNAIAGSKVVLARGASYLVLWIGDDRANDLPNLSELQRIEWNSVTSEIWSYRGTFPSNWTAEQKTAADTTYQLSDNFDTVTTSLKAGSYFPGAKWATSITAWSSTLDNASPQLTRLVSYRFTVKNGQNSDTAVGAVAVRQ